MSLLKKHNIAYQLYQHEPILNYEDALREQKNHKWKWTEAKSVFITNKKWKYYLFVTIMGKNVDFKKLKQLTWEKLSIASREEVKSTAYCIPGCVPPFWLPSNVSTIVDEIIFDTHSYLFSPAISTETIQLDPNDLKIIFDRKQVLYF